MAQRWNRKGNRYSVCSIWMLAAGFCVLLVLCHPDPICALNVNGEITHLKISATQGNFTGDLDEGDEFGISVSRIGDLDGDGVEDIAVGALNDDDGGSDRGAIWVLFLNGDGTVKNHQKISATQGNFTGNLNSYDWFGRSVSRIGDLDGDGITELAVGANGDNDGGQEQGAVWILFLNGDGTVKHHQKISETQGNFTGDLDEGDEFGISVSGIGDLDGDGITELAVGAVWDDDGGENRGAVWILFLNSDGTVKNHQKISETQGNFTGDLDELDLFGVYTSDIGDLDGDGIAELAVGARWDEDGGANYGAVWVLFLNTDGTVKSHQKISSTQGNFTGNLDEFNRFGEAVLGIGDLDGDGITELAVGANGDSDGGQEQGAVWILFLNADGTVKNHQKISATRGNFSGELDHDDAFGSSLSGLGDLDGDGIAELVVGASLDDDGGPDHGAIWVLFLSAEGTVKPPNFSVSLDADTSPGDQANHALRGVEPGSVVSIQVFGRDIQETVGFSARFEYDSAQIVYEGLNLEDVILPSAQSPGAEHGTGYVEVTAASFSGPITANEGLLGTIRFQTTSSFSGTAIDLVSATLRRHGQFERLNTGLVVELQARPSPDFNGNGTIDFGDFLLLAQAYGSRRGDDKYEYKFDLDTDDRIGFTDFLIFAETFGNPAGGSKPAWLSRSAELPISGHHAGTGLDLSALPGGKPDVVEVSVRLSASKRMWGYHLRIRYDAATMELVEAIGAEESIFAQGSGQVALQVSLAPGEILLADVLRSESRVEDTPELVQLRFQVLDGPVGKVEILEAMVADETGQIDILQGVGLEDMQLLPRTYALHHNIPNPFNPATQIGYELPQAGEVSLMIYNALGQPIRKLMQGHQEAGSHNVQWDGKDTYGQAVSSGVYLYRLKSGEFTQTRRMLLLK